MIKNCYKPYTTINFLHFYYDSLKLHLSIGVSVGKICKNINLQYTCTFFWIEGGKKKIMPLLETDGIYNFKVYSAR